MVDKTKIFAFLIAGLLVCVVCLVCAFASGQEGDTTDSADTDLCPCLWYTSEKCECMPESTCSCAQCTKDENCQCVDKLKQGTGTVKGKLNNRYARFVEGVVYIPKMQGRTFRLPPQNPMMDQKDLIFTPHILPVLVGSTVDFPNSDTVRHNVFSTPKSAKIFNLGNYSSGVVKHVTFDEPGEVALLCHVHAEMSAYVIVCRTPYFARTNKRDGSFVIPNVPAGSWELTFFHQKLKAKTIPITVTAGKETIVEFADLKRR